MYISSRDEAISVKIMRFTLSRPISFYNIFAGASILATNGTAVPWPILGESTFNPFTADPIKALHFTLYHTGLTHHFYF